MKEGNMISAINRHIVNKTKAIHTQSMTLGSGSMNGTPDRYYDGPCQDLWVEFKVWPTLPRFGQISVAPVRNVKKQPQGRVTVLQAKWIERRWHSGKNAFVIVGFPDRTALVIEGCAVYVEVYNISERKPLKEIAAWIINYSGA